MCFKKMSKKGPEIEKNICPLAMKINILQQQSHKPYLLFRAFLFFAQSVSYRFLLLKVFTDIKPIIYCQ